MPKLKTLVLLLPVLALSACESAGPAAGSADPHGAYTPEQARAAAAAHFQNLGAPGHTAPHIPGGKAAPTGN